MQFTIIKCKDLQHTSVFIKCQDVQKHNKGVRGEFLGEQWRRRGGGVRREAMQSPTHLCMTDWETREQNYHLRKKHTIVL